MPDAFGIVPNAVDCESTRSAITPTAFGIDIGTPRTIPSPFGIVADAIGCELARSRVVRTALGM
jgi:hypothetical protein